MPVNKTISPSTPPILLSKSEDERQDKLEKLPPELKDKIVSYLPLKNLTKLERVSRHIQSLALAAWRHEVPLAKRRSTMDSNAGTAAWKKAWISQRTHLETSFGQWGVQASQACKFLPDEINPFDVESQCNQWLKSENDAGNSQAEKILVELFIAIQGHKSVLQWRGRNLHTLPPFIGKIKSLQQLNLEDNHFEAIRLTDMPALQELRLGHNQLRAIDLENLPALQALYLDNNQLQAIDLEDLPALQALYLDNNQLKAAGLKSLPALQELSLNNNQLQGIDLKGLPALQALSLDENQFQEIELGGSPTLETLSLDSNQLKAIALKHMPVLKTLCFGSNQLKAIALEDLPALQELDLEDNRLNAIVLKDLPALQYMYLHKNQRHLVAAEYQHSLEFL